MVKNFHFIPYISKIPCSWLQGASISGIRIFQHSNTGNPKQLAIFAGKAIDLAQKTGFFRTHEKKATPFQPLPFPSLP
jgi:hypothetical protein